MSTCNFPDVIPVNDVFELAQLLKDRQLIAQKWHAAQLLFCVGGSVAKKLEGSPVTTSQAAEFDLMGIDQLADYIVANKPDGEVTVLANPLLEYAIQRLIELLIEKFFGSIQ